MNSRRSAVDNMHDFRLPWYGGRWAKKIGGRINACVGNALRAGENVRVL